MTRRKLRDIITDYITDHVTVDDETVEEAVGNILEG